jgi:hypothetical protein
MGGDTPCDTLRRPALPKVRRTRCDCSSVRRQAATPFSARTVANECPKERTSARCAATTSVTTRRKPQRSSGTPLTRRRDFGAVDSASQEGLADSYLLGQPGLVGASDGIRTRDRRDQQPGVFRSGRRSRTTRSRPRLTVCGRGLLACAVRVRPGRKRPRAAAAFKFDAHCCGGLASGSRVRTFPALRPVHRLAQSRCANRHEDYLPGSGNNSPTSVAPCAEA